MSWFKQIGKAADAAKQGAESTESIIDDTSRRKNATRRQEIDMLSDSWLSKNIRPLIMLWLMFLITGVVVCNLFGVEVERYMMEKVLFAFTAAIFFYFPGRMAEKFIKKSDKLGFLGRVFKK